MHRVAAALLLAATLGLAAPAAAQAPIGREELRGHLSELARIATENGGNRAAGLPGDKAAADYIADRLAAAGWNVSRTDVPFDFWMEEGTPTLGSLRHGRDFLTLHYSGAGEVTARVQPIRGGGCSRRDFRRFRRGGLAILAADACTFSRAANLARRAGAKGILLADYTDGPPTQGTLGRPGIGLPVLSVRVPILRRMARRRPRVHLRVDTLEERRVTQNVIAELPGTASGPIVMAGGHMDSIPRGAGMNDNGSGVVALLASARLLAQRPRRPATVRLGFWAAHENGIFGSTRYVRALPPAERRRIRAYLNIDMVGSPNGVPEVYATRKRLRRVLLRHLRGAGRTSSGGSDDIPFIEAGIPSGGIFTGSLEPKYRRQARRWGGEFGVARDACYHQPCDDLDNVSLRMLELTANATANALGDLAR